jgi:DNA-binding Xre family transcriptional regulator
MRLRLRVKELIQERKISMTRLSRIADVNYKTVAGMVKDPYRDVEYKPLYKIARSLGVTLDELIIEEEE